MQVGTRNEIRRNIDTLEGTLKTLRDLAGQQYKPAECPLRHNHYLLSQIIFGPGQVEWHCGFCGLEETE